MKGVILAGGLGSRLGDLTIAVNKHLLPIYDKPMVYYPLATLLSAGIKDVTLVCNQKDIDSFSRIVEKLDLQEIEIRIIPQSAEKGIPSAIKCAIPYLDDSGTLVILGDNLIYGAFLGNGLQELAKSSGAVCFLKSVNNPENYGICQISPEGTYKLVEKPKNPESNRAVIGLYYFDRNLVHHLNSLKVSERGETEVIDLLNSYLNENLLRVEELHRSSIWFDAGDINSLLEAANFVSLFERRTNSKVLDPIDAILKHSNN